jgi:hypothetical protein
MSLLHVSCFVRDLEIKIVAGFIRVKSFWWRGTAYRWKAQAWSHPNPILGVIIGVHKESVGLNTTYSEDDL